MVIDSHTHIRAGNEDIGAFIKGMDEAGVDMSVVCPIAPVELGFHDNEYVAKLVKQHPDRIIGYASVHPADQSALDELRRGLEDYGLKGLKLHPPIQNFSMLDPCVGPIIEACIDYDIPILVHTGPVYSRESRMIFSNSVDIDELAIRYPEAKLIIAHGHPFGIDPVMVAKHENVYIDTTSTTSEYLTLFPQLDHMLYDWMRRDDRILFGSDSNQNHPERFASDLKPLRAMNIPEESKEKLFSGNIKRLLHMD